MNRADRFRSQVAARDAAARARSYAARLETGEMPSALLAGRRVLVLAVQDHPVVGRRVQVDLGGIGGGVVVWTNAATDLRGEPRVSIVPPICDECGHHRGYHADDCTADR